MLDGVPAALALGLMMDSSPATHGGEQSFLLFQSPAATLETLKNKRTRDKKRCMIEVVAFQIRGKKSSNRDVFVETSKETAQKLNKVSDCELVRLSQR